MRHRHDPSPIAIVFVVVTAGCADTAPDAPLTVERDSAGIVIVENRVDLSAATCEVTERLRIGEVAGDPDYELYRVFDSARLPDGSLAVLAHNQVRVYGPDGVYRHRFGGTGGGPGEFRNALQLAVRGDTVVVVDGQPHPISFFDLAGTFLGSVRPPQNPGSTWAYPLTDGRFLFSSACCLGGDDGFRSRELSLMVYDLAGMDTIATLPYDVVGLLAERFYGTPLFGPRAQFHPGNRGFVYGAGIEPEIEVRSLDGSVRRLVRWSLPPEPVRPADVEAHLASLPEVPASMSHFQDAERNPRRPVAETFPALAMIRVGENADIWVLRYPRPPVSADRRDWLVFDGDGRFRCHATLPQMRVHQAGADHIRGLVRDDLDVEYVIEYEVSPPPSEGRRTG